MVDLAREARKKRIVFVVDDISVNREPVVAALWDAGFEVAVAPSPASALELLAKGLMPDVIIVNLLVAGNAGWDIWDHRQATAALRSVPVVALTTVGTPGSVGDAIIVKLPAAPAVVVAATKDAIRDAASPAR